MKTILYMSITANGFIAREDDETDFVSDNEWNFFKDMINQTRNIVIGKRTYELMKEDGNFKEMKDKRIVILDPEENKNYENFVFVKSPKEAIAVLEKKGFNTALLAGGAATDASYLVENLIDEIYLDVMPFVLGKGIKLFAEGEFEAKLELIDTKKLSDNEI